MLRELERAWFWRESNALWSEGNQALRMFHGPGESAGMLRDWAVDRFGEHYWITQWEGRGASGADRVASGGLALESIRDFLVARGARSAVWLGRPEQGVPHLPKILIGKPPAGRFEVCELGLKYGIQLLDVRHPGLFLDHAPLRRWLFDHARGWSVLNTFAYTGSLSIAAAAGGAEHVTTLDLSRPTIQWAEENWARGGFPPERARFVYGDVFEWLPRLIKGSAQHPARRYDCVILDPPSFSRGPKGSFSTAKDLRALHELAFDALAPLGTLITSINSANVAWSKYEADVAAAARAKGFRLEVLRKIEQPETFPARAGAPETAYLKGWVFKALKS